jgi:hypothetical protein
MPCIWDIQILTIHFLFEKSEYPCRGTELAEHRVNAAHFLQKQIERNRSAKAMKQNKTLRKQKHRVVGT